MRNSVSFWKIRHHSGIGYNPLFLPFLFWHVSARHLNVFSNSSILSLPSQPQFIPTILLRSQRLSNKQSTVSEHSHRARPPLRSARGTANPLPRRPPSSFPSSVSASQPLLFPTESPCTQPFNASNTMLISSSIVTALEASLRPYDRRSPSQRSFPRSKNDEPKPFSRSGCESRSRRLCIPSTRQRETYGRDEGLWTAMKQKKKANVHSAD